MKIGKRESQRLARRAQIITLAREEFFENGYEATTMSGIAARLGGSKRTLWAYFSSKEALFTAVVEDTAAGLRSRIEMPRDGGDAVVRITKLCRSAIDLALSPTAISMFRLVGSASDRHPDVAATFFARGPAETQREVGNYLAGNFADVLWTSDFLTAGRDLMTLAASEMHFEQVWGLLPSPTAAERDAKARHAASLFLRAYARDPDALISREELASQSSA
ncbi:TetR/AcrR family transcriptional regulator [Novosphingobium sp. Gsoil 351]|uniref:TetR/AcrR family transcriptional regulator n=1 Tax=Novosphingobium sp. Gsoil 351 TaxID=2675225 RepID=UPI0018A84688|nr:TetR/AcrR family transcriptional regulator [Novosphingobium sp. Gsoil 351]